MNTRILIAPDSFKGSLSALRAAEAIRRGILGVLPDARISLLPIADGGEGTVDAILAGAGGRRVEVTVTGPLGMPVPAAYGVLADGRTAVVEAAAACGLHLLRPEERNPFLATTRGVGELLMHAAATGCETILLGVGGSATNDAGAGMLKALGARFLGADGAELPDGAAGLESLAYIDMGAWRWPQQGPNVVLAADVTNPLCGPQGASAVYGRQKFPSHEDATPTAIRRLDRILERVAEVAAPLVGEAAAYAPGAGAAGGLGYAALAFLGATMRPGVQVVLEATRFNERAQDVDLVVTGEGALDSQTLYGKAVRGVCEAAQSHGVPVVAIAGSVSATPDELRALGLAAWCSIAQGPMDLPQMLASAESLVEAAAGSMARWLTVGHRLP